MISTIVTFQYLDMFDAAKLRTIAATARARFENMPGLRSKLFTLNPAARQAVNVYVWDSEQSAKAFFSEELLARVTLLYGVRPSVAFLEIAEFVEARGSARGRENSAASGSSRDQLDDRSASSVRERTPSFE